MNNCFYTHFLKTMYKILKIYLLNKSLINELSKKTKRYIAKRMREQKKQQALTGTCYSSTCLNKKEDLGFTYFWLNLSLNLYLINTFK